MIALEKNYEYFEENLPSLLKQYRGRFIVLKGCKVEGDFSTAADAYSYAIDNYDLGEFIIQECLPESELEMTFYTQNVKFS